MVHFTYENEVVVEEFVEGGEYTVAVVDGKAYPVVQIVPVQGFYDYENKYKPGGSKRNLSGADFRRTDKTSSGSSRGWLIMHWRWRSYARLDFIVTKDEKIYCLEANTLRE